MKKALVAAFLCLALSACRGLKTTSPAAAPTPTQGTATVEATIADPGR